MMDIEFGTKVVDKSDKLVGTVGQLIHNTYTGEISKFVVRRQPIVRSLFCSLDDVLEVTKTKVKLNISVDELG